LLQWLSDLRTSKSHLQTADNGNFQVKFLGSCNNALGNDVAPHDATENVDQNGVHLENMEILVLKIVINKNEYANKSGKINISAKMEMDSLIRLWSLYCKKWLKIFSRNLITYSRHLPETKSQKKLGVTAIYSKIFFFLNLTWGYMGIFTSWLFKKKSAPNLLMKISRIAPSSNCP
jgi:hypothetical protein